MKRIYLHPSTLAKRGSILLFLGLIAFYFYGLGGLPFIGPDEPRYAEVAREMVARHDWVTPTLGGQLWFEKPALLYWLIISAFKIGGVSEAAARSGAALCGLLTTGAVFFMGRRVDIESETNAGELGFWSALVAGTSAGMIAFSRAASFDIVVTATIAWAFAFYFAAELATSKTKQRRLLVGFYFAIGLSLLAKGLVGFVIPFGVIGTYYTLRGKAPSRTILSSALWGLPLSLVVAATWYGPMIWKHGSPFLVEFIIKHHFQRYATNIYHHPGPVYYYLLILPALALPWTILFFDSVWKARKVLWRGGDDAFSKLQTFAAAWIAVPLVFFSFSGSKLPGYILPALPAAALMIGSGIARDYAGKKSWAIRATGALALLLGIGVLVFARQSEKISFSTAALIAAICGAVALATIFFTRQLKATAALMAIATLALVVVALIRVAPTLVEPESSKNLIQQADERGYANLPLFGLQRDDRSPEFYAPGRVVYGDDREPIMYDGIGQVVYESHARGKMLFLIPLKDLDRLNEAQSVKAEPIANNGRIAIVVVTPQ